MVDVPFKDEDVIFKDEDVVFERLEEAGGVAFGYETPDAPETAMSWETWRTAAGEVVTVLGDADYGDMVAPFGAPLYSPVIDMAGTGMKTIGVTCPKYGSNTGNVALAYRGSASPFLSDDATPSWNAYSAPVQQEWRYFQVRVTGN